MTISQIPHEHRFFVSSSSRADVTHVVDLDYREEPWNKAHAACGCESNFIYGRMCPHILAVVDFIQSGSLEETLAREYLPTNQTVSGNDSASRSTATPPGPSSHGEAFL